ncbi:MAG: restriction endonuclease subunit S [Pseudomonadales bacterium]|nr:restriction endonuclease subunit S [Pseudomonadales bacterium]MCB1667269.1 restriction endonuclease subunit S [Pseudomonadales bacterium]MCP5170794.1 restriction endonuclease subunit S [Pseudomonadales bacterium]
MAVWKKVKVGDFLFEREGRYKPDANEIEELKRINKIDFSGNFHIANKPSKTDMILIKQGDLVISGINVAKGALGVYHGKDDVTATIHYSSYTFDESKVSVEYFKRFLKSPLFIQLLKDQVKGGIKTEIKPKHLLPLEILLPEKAEQLAILKKFQRIENEDSEFKVELTYQQTLLKKLRQQILQDAIEGKLTADWRAENPGVEPASELLKRIAAEKEQLVKDKKIKAQKTLSSINDEDKTFELPERWEWCQLNDVIYENPRNGYSPRTVDFPTQTKTLKLGATTTGKFIDSEIKYINEEVSKDSFLWLKARDILIQRGNSMDFVGVSAIYHGEESSFIYPDLMMKLKPVTSVSEVYLHHVLMSIYCREYFRKNATGAQKSMPKINQATVSGAMIPLCSKIEQEVIVSKVKNLLALCDQLENQINQNQTHAEQLMQAVLKEAFSHTHEVEQTADVRPLDNIVPFKPKGADYYKRTLLAAEIVHQLHKEPTLGHLKLQKLIYLCQKTESMQLPTQFLKQVAGPYDNRMARSIDKQLKDKKWFSYNRDKVPKYTPLEKAGEHQVDFDKYFAPQKDGIHALIRLFRKAKSDQLEIVATLYACWEDILKKQEPLSEDLLVQHFYEWSEEKSKYEASRIYKAIEWMRGKDIVPDPGKIVHAQ